MFERLPGAVKQYAEDHLGMAFHSAVEGMWQGRDQVVVGEQQCFFVLLHGPCCRYL
jgi:hypothetical protein